MPAPPTTSSSTTPTSPTPTSRTLTIASVVAGCGYTALNDLAVTAAVLRREGLVQRVLIVDLDVHQGDGTAEIFKDEPEVGKSVRTVKSHGVGTTRFLYVIQ